MEQLMKKTPVCAFTALLLATLVVASGCSSESQDAVEQSSGDLSASHILIMYKGSERAPDEIKRTKEEALDLVQEIAAEAKAEGADFAALAREYSDCPSGLQTGGDLGSFQPHGMAPAFSGATAKLAIGELSDPVETPFGYHIILRQEL
jgi:parvulin-like peptidyl-prolyl isomerase